MHSTHRKRQLTIIACTAKAEAIKQWCSLRETKEIRLHHHPNKPKRLFGMRLRSTAIIFFVKSYEENQMTGNLPYDLPYNYSERFILKLYGDRAAVLPKSTVNN